MNPSADERDPGAGDGERPNLTVELEASTTDGPAHRPRTFFIACGAPAGASDLNRQGSRIGLRRLGWHHAQIHPTTADLDGDRRMRGGRLPPGARLEPGRLRPVTAPRPGSDPGGRASRTGFDLP